MIDPGYVRSMARYNRWQNQNLYGVADGLSDADRKLPRGAFFGSIHATLNHLLWADRIWMSRLAGTAPPSGGIPESVSTCEAWSDLKRERDLTDDAIVAWADGIDQTALDGDLTWYSWAIKAQIGKPRWLLVTHMFNHQTHHRGQVHCLLTQAGGKPADTDLSFMPASM